MCAPVRVVVVSFGAYSPFVDVCVSNVDDVVETPAEDSSESVVLSSSDDDVVAVVVVVGAEVVVVVVAAAFGWTLGGSTCMVSDICFEHGLAAPSVATMTTWNVPTVIGDASDVIRPEVESTSKVLRTTLSVLAAKLRATSPLSPKSSSVTSITTTVVLTSTDMLTKWTLPESGLWNTGQWSFASRTRMWS